MVGVGREIAAGDVDAEGTAGDRAGIGGAVDGQGDDVAALDVAADRAGDGYGAAGFRRVEDVVGGDGIDGDAGRDGGVDIVEMGCRRRRAVAGRVGGADAGVDGMVGVGRQVAAGNVDAEGSAGDRAGIGGAVDRQGDDVAIWTSPPTVPVTATVPPASAALRTLSVVMASTAMLAEMVVSTL